jgi:hypothetical protein
MFVSFYTILKQRLKVFWTSTHTNFNYEPPLLEISIRSNKMNGASFRIT